MTGQHLCQGAGLEFKKGCVCMQDMLFTYTVLATDYTLPLFKQQSHPVKKIFGTMQSLWKRFSYSPKKAEALKVVQSILNSP